MNPLALKNITKGTFVPYGTVLDHIHKDPAGDEMVYEPVVTVESKGWIWAVLTFQKQDIDSIQCHPTSKESFEPVYGTMVLVVAPPEKPEKMEAFLLDRPVMVNEGVWHNVFSLAAESRVKITENNDVTSKTIELKRPLRVTLGETPSQ